MLDELLEAIRTNNRINLLLIDEISAEGLKDTLSTRGGRDVAAQLAHIHTNRVWQMEKRGKAFAEGLVKFSAKDEPTRAQLKRAMTASGKALEKFFTAIVDGKARCLKKGPLNYLAYFISHEAHHRGNILLTLKQCGHKLDRNTAYSLWDWDRR